MALSTYEFDFLSKIIAIPSVGGETTEIAPYGEMPLKILNFFLDEAAKEGFKTGNLDNKVGWVEFGEGEKLFAIVCHLDVVPSGDGWTTNPFELTIKDNSYYGRGIIDDKGPACAAFFSMKQLKDSGFIPNFRIRLILGTDEERTCSCVEHYAENAEIPFFAITPDAEFPAIFAEKGILHVKVFDPKHSSNIIVEAGSAANMVAPKASATLSNGETINIKGKMAHASRPELGINAINLLADKLISDYKLNAINIINYINDFNDSFTGIDFEDESGKLTTNFGILTMSDSEESLIIDIRYPYTAKFENIMSSLKESASKYNLEVEVDGHMAPIYLDKNSDEIKMLTNIWENHMMNFSGYKEEFQIIHKDPIAIGGGTYARHLPNTVAFGIQAPWQEDQCHQADEHISIADFDELIVMLKEVIKSI